MGSVAGHRRDSTSMSWTEARIANGLAQSFENRSVLVVPNTSWTGSEADLLMVARNLKLIDLEIKISRSDLRADKQKSKWFSYRSWRHRVMVREWTQTWPRLIWKHYYAIPSSIWDEALLPVLPPISGVLLLTMDARMRGGLRIDVARKAKPNKEAKPITPAEAVDLARLTGLRYWKLRVAGECKDPS